MSFYCALILYIQDIKNNGGFSSGGERDEKIEKMAVV